FLHLDRLPPFIHLEHRRQLERIEGMRVSMASMTVGGPTLGSVNEPNATATSSGVFFGTVTGVARAFREAGIQHPDVAPTGTIPPIPRFDTNPEVIRVDSDGQTGTTAINVSTTAIVTGLVGPLDYTFRHYTILPDLASPPSVAGGMTATAVTTPLGDELTIASYNIERFFDDVNDPAIGEPVLTATAYQNRLAKASLGIRDFLRTPDIVGIIEIENLTTLQALATKINADAVAASQPNPMYVAYLIEGNDIGGIDVGFLVKTAIVTGATPRVTVNGGVAIQELDASLFVNPDSSTETLHDRPPLRLDATVNFANGASFPVQVIVNHLRSLNGVDAATAGSNGWATDGARVRAKRLAQAVDLANLVQTRQANNPNERIVLVGDFNFFEVNDGYGDSMSTLLGAPVPDNQTVVPGDGVDLVNPDLTLLLDTLLQRYSFVFDGNAQSLDHAIVNSALIAGTLARRVEHARINGDFPETARNGTVTVERLADHDPLVVYLKLAACTLTCPSNITTVAASGQCGASVTYSAPTTGGTCGTVTCSPASGSTFNVGTTTVTCMQSGGSPTCSFTVTVTDNQAPTVACPANITTNTASGQCSATVTYTTPTATDNCAGATVACSPASGTSFAKGVTTVTCMATDAANLTGTCTFTVTVTDNQAP
ncbi:MAG: HYR domain-containing protein, partial [Acidobacteriota bacterium]